MRPLSLVENSEFKKLCLLLDPRYNVPSRRHFSDKVIPGLYEEVKENTVAKLQLANSVALTTDSWTSRACQSYVTITAHFTDQLWAIQSCVLQIRTLDVSHTGVNIGNALKVALIEWKLDHHHDIALVTDNAQTCR